MQDKVTCEVIGIEELSALRRAGVFDGAFSNFGAFNCVRDLRSAASDLGRLISPGGTLVLCFMGCFCLWETAWYLIQGKPAKAFRRFRGSQGIETSLGSKDRFSLYYPSLAGLTAAFRDEFRLVSLRGIGVLTPPSFMEPWAKRNRRLVNKLARLDTRLGRWPVLRGTGDHRLAIFVRKGWTSLAQLSEIVANPLYGYLHEGY